MKYQDTWINGQLVEKGIRECESRYIAISNFCRINLNNKFTVCDIGANMNYFGNRLSEDFGAKIIGFEFNDFKNRSDIIKKQKTKNIMYVNRKISLNDIKILEGIAKFDLILALSVLHHNKGNLDEWIKSLLKISKYLIIEFAGSDARKSDKKNLNYTNQNYELLSLTDSHIDKNKQRKLVLFKNL